MKTILYRGTPGTCLCIFTGWSLMLYLLLIVTISLAAATEPQALQEEDCVKCHWFQQKTVAESGGRHATEVGCLSCHPQHPPEEDNTIAACVSCHVDQPHFQIADCLQCHADPHKPLVSLRDPVKPLRQECLSCHSEVGQQMAASTSRHADLFCTNCHNRHGFIPSCLDCHSPHLEQQKDGSCLQCHPAHQPRNVVPAGWVPAEFCQVCHDKEGKDLAATTTLHGGVNCVYCHNGQHPSVPSCQNCHGLPHDQLLHSKFRRCLTDCHGDAHALLSSR